MNPTKTIETHNFSNSSLESSKEELLKKIKELEIVDSNTSKKHLDKINQDFSDLISDGNISISDTLDLSKKIYDLVFTVEKEIAEKKFSKFDKNLNFSGLKKQFENLVVEMKTKSNNSTFINEKINLDIDIEQINDFIKKIDSLNSDISGDTLERKKEIFSKLIEYSKKFYVEVNGDSNFFVMKGFLEKLGEVEDKYKKDREEIRKEAEDKQKQLAKEKNEEKANEIKGITIDGSFEIPEDFDDLIEQYDDAISDLREKQAVSSDIEKKQYDDAIELLERNKKTLTKLKDDTDKITGSYIDDEFDKIADKITNAEGNGPITIEIFGADKTFLNKEEAYAILKEMKTQIHEELKSGWRTLFETADFVYGGILKGVNYLFFDTGKDLGVDGIENIASLEPLAILGGLIEEVAALGFGVLGISVLATIGGMHTSVIESVYRRGLKDPLGSFGFNQYEDYGKRGINSNPVGDPSKLGYKDFFEYQQRQGLVEHFNQKLKALDNTSKEYKILKDNIAILEKFKLNKTNTFYYIANKMSKDMKLGILGNLDPKTFLYNSKRTLIDGGHIIGYNPFKKDADGNRLKGIRKDGKFQWPRLGGFHGITIDRTQNLYSETMNLLTEVDDQLTKGVEIFYKNKFVETNIDKNVIKTSVENIDGEDGSIKTDKYNNVIDYINSQQISDTKKKGLIKKFEDYIERVGKELKYPENIYKDIFVLLNVDFEDPNKQLKTLTKEIKGMENKFGILDTIKDKAPFLKKGSLKYRNLIAFRDLIASGEWIGTKNEYNEAIKEIENDNSIDANIDSKIGAGDIETKFNDVINKGESVSIESGIIKGELFDKIGDSYKKSKLSDYLKNVEDYIGYKMGDNELEDSAKKELTNYFDKVIKNEIFIESDEKLKIEIGKILKGGLTQDTIINKLDASIRSNFTELQKQKIKDLKEDIIKNPYTIVTEKELNIITKKVILGSSLNDIEFDHSKVIDLSKVDSDIESAKGMRKNDFFPEGADENRIKDDFSKLEYIFEFDSKLDNSSRKQELNLLKDSILKRSNKYTVSQALYSIEEIQEGSKFKDIYTDNANDTTNTLEDLINDKKELLKNNFNSLEIDDKIKYLEDNKEYNGNQFKKGMLEDYIETTISEIEKSDLSNTEKVAMAKELRSSIKNDIDSGRIKGNIDALIKLEGIARLEASFSSYKTEFESGIENDRKKELLGKLDDIFDNELSDAELKSKIDSLKAEINSSINNAETEKQKETHKENTPTDSTNDSVKTSTESKEVLTLDEKITKLKSKYLIVIKQLQLDLRFNDSQKAADALYELDPTESTIDKQLKNIDELFKINYGVKKLLGPRQIETALQEKAAVIFGKLEEFGITNLDDFNSGISGLKEKYKHLKSVHIEEYVRNYFKKL